MLGGYDPIASGWGRVGEGRAWPSRIRSSGTGAFQSNTGDFSASLAITRLRESPSLALLPKSFAQELSALAREKDPLMFFTGLLAFGERCEAVGRLDSAAEVYSTLLGEGSLVSIQVRARQRLEALQGRGSFGFRAELLTRDFSRQATHPASLAALMAGGLAFRATRLATLNQLLNSPGKSFWTSTVGARFLASSTAFLAEVPAVTIAGNATSRLMGEVIPDSIGQQMASGALVLGSMRLVGWSVGRTLRPPAGTRPALQGSFQQAGMFGGILLGHHLEIAAGLKTPPQDAGSLLSESLATLLQVQVAGRLTHGVLGNRLRLWEMEAQARPHRPPVFPWGFSLRNYSLVGAASYPGSTGQGPALPLPPPQTERPLLPQISISKMSYLGEGLGKEGLRLKERYRALFPPQGEGVPSEEILHKALQIPLELPLFHERLLEALAEAPDRGSVGQFYKVWALEDVFRTNALKSSTGSWDYVLLQLLVGQILADDQVPRRKTALRELFRAMDTGWRSTSPEELLGQFSYDAQLTLHSDRAYPQAFENQIKREIPALEAYRPEDRTLILNFIYAQASFHPKRASRMIESFVEGRDSGHYSAAAIDAALDYARDHPQGMILLQRIFHIFASGDIPGKLWELRPLAGKKDTAETIWRMLARGMNLEHVAQSINGSYHTAYLKDIRLARKVAYVTHEMFPYFQDPSKREPEKEKLRKAIFDFLGTGKALSDYSLINIIKANHSSQVDSLVGAWLLGKFTIGLAQEEELAQWNDQDQYDIARFIPSQKPGMPHRILVRPLPPHLDLSTPQEKKTAYYEMHLRINAVVHEWEHWRHSTGNYEGIERLAQPIIFYSGNIEDRLSSEVMAYLEDNLWRIQNSDGGYIQVARALGVNLPLYWRNHADRAYFRASNEEDIQKISKEP